MSTRPEAGSPDELAWLRGFEEARNHFLAENVRLREASRIYRNGLDQIVSKRDKTLLADCCVEKSCRPHFEDGREVGECAYRVGVNHGYAYQAAEAEEILWEATALEGKE